MTDPSRPGSRMLPLLLALLAAPQAAFAEEATASPLEIVAVTVEPEKPAADTLCRLRVKIRNGGDQVASQLGFSVRLNGQELAVYGNQLFMYPLPPGEEREIPLYNFWTTETSRAMPADKKLRVEVALEEARWWKIETEGDTETWTPTGDVVGLPQVRTLVVEMSQ